MINFVHKRVRSISEGDNKDSRKVEEIKIDITSEFYVLVSVLCIGLCPVCMCTGLLSCLYVYWSLPYVLDSVLFICVLVSVLCIGLCTVYMCTGLCPMYKDSVLFDV